MADYSSVNGTDAANIDSVNGVAKTSIGDINGTNSPPAAGATRWVVGMSSENVGYAPNSDRTSWTFYDMVSGGGNPDASDVAYGKDGSGNGIYVMSRQSTSKELFVSSTDVTTVGDWTVIDLDSPDRVDQFGLLWADNTDSPSTSGVWVAVGEQDNSKIYRSTDGAATWTGVSLSSLAGHSGTGISMIACDGAGKWMFGQDERIYYSTDDAATWSVSTPFSTNTPDRIEGICFTNNTWVVAYERSGAMYARSCDASDITAWGSEAAITGTAGAIPIPNTGLGKRCTTVGANGRVAFVSHGNATSNGRVGYADFNGVNITNMDTVQLSTGSDGPKDMATDGQTWLICTLDGDLWESTNSAQTWTEIATNIRTTTDDALCITPDVHLPL